jgi:hypothetical protein
MARAFFGPPQEGPSRGGLQVSVYLVPVHDGRLIVFDVTAPAARGRWLPWAVTGFGQNPYEAAAMLADDWLDVPLHDLSLADVMSFDIEGGGWELAIVFRAELAAPPRPSTARTPVALAAGHLDAIGPFDPVDLERWLAGPPGAGAAAPARQEAPEPGPGGLVF